MKSKLLISALFSFALGAIAMYFYLLEPEQPPQAPTVHVDREALIFELQVLSGLTFEEASDSISQLSNEEQQVLIEAYVRDEVMYREAGIKDLGTRDSLIRTTMVERMETYRHALDYDTLDFTEEEIRAYFDAHKSDYYNDARLTFAHVFANATRGNALYRARMERESLNQFSIPYDGAPGQGDLFKYHTYYTNRPSSYIDLHFGDGFAELLAKQPISKTHWIGPFESNAGFHNVLLLAKKPGREAVYEEVKHQVLADMHTQHYAHLNMQAIQELIDKYEVTLSADL